jgi:hypothetical protein
MRITVLAVPDCPNAPLALQRVRAALAGRPATVEMIEVRDEGQAAELGMCGSPTVLIDGTDPFRDQAAVPGVSCRLYRDPGGGTAGAPSEAALRAALV